MKKIISLVLVLVLVLTFVGALYAMTETQDCKTVELTKIEGLKNSLGVQKLDIRVNGFAGFRHIQNCCFEDKYFDGSEIINVADPSQLNIKIFIFKTGIYKWESKIFNLENGLNEVIWEYNKPYTWQKIKIKFTFMVSDCPETTAATAATTTETSTTIAVTTATPDSTQTIENTTAAITPTATPEVTTTPESTGTPTGTLPNTGEKDLNFLIVIGIAILFTGAYFAIRLIKSNS